MRRFITGIVGGTRAPRQHPKVQRTYVGRLERGESGVTVEALAAILAALGVSLGEFFRPFRQVVRPRTPRRRG